MRNKVGINCGSGQRPFVTTPEIEWWNVDSQEKWNPDIICDAARTPFDSEYADYVVLHHVLEHFGCGEAIGLVQEARRVLKPGGSLLIFVPDLRRLAQLWITGGIGTQVYATNLYGAYMGDEADRHKWGFDEESLRAFLEAGAKWQIKEFDWRTIPGADIARDDRWILGVECLK